MAAVPWIAGSFRHILHPPARGADPAEQWYINDHCFAAGNDGRLHWFGITNPYPRDGNLYGPGSHRHIGHASAARPFGPWEAHDHAFALPETTTENIGACFVVPSGDGFLMLFNATGGLHAARSRDLHAWVEAADAPVVSLGEGTRDPCVVRLDDGTHLLYGAAGWKGRSAVALASSRDLVRWELREPALLSDIAVPWGALESPFVHRRGGDWYLFVNHSHRQYEETLVFHSRDPFRFDWERPLCTLFAHAAEIFEREGRTYISHCGIEDRHWSDTGAPYGLWLAELRWADGGD